MESGEIVIAINWSWTTRGPSERPTRASWLVALRVPDQPRLEPLAALRQVARALAGSSRRDLTWEGALFGAREADLAGAGLRRLHGVAVRPDHELSLSADARIDDAPTTDNDAGHGLTGS